MELTAQNVKTVYEKCTAKNENDKSNILVNGVVHNHILNKNALEENRADICSMLDELPEPFTPDAGGGWSFLEACMTKTGKHWGEHIHMELLFVLGMGIGVVQESLPRELWNMLPGGVPYYIVDTKKNNPTKQTDSITTMCCDLKTALFSNGTEAIDDFLGYEHNVNEDKDVTEARMDEVLDQMPEEEIRKFWDKYVNNK